MVKKNIRIFNIKYSEDESEKILQYFKDVLDTAFLSNHKYCRKLEAELEKYCKNYKAISCSSATTGLEAVFRYIDVKNKAVLVQSNTFIATGHAVQAAGGIVVPIDLNEDYIISFDDVKKAFYECKNLSIDIAAMCIVNISGRISEEIFKIQKFCEANQIKLVEDNAQGLLSTLDKKQLGSLSDFSVTSFQTTKVIACGEGGAILCKKEKDALNIRDYIFYGKDKENNLLYLNESGNFKLSELNAALAFADLERSPERIRRRQEIDKMYKEGVRSKFFYYLNHPNKNIPSNYKTIFIAKSESVRESLETYFKENGVAMTGYVYKIPLHKQPRIYNNKTFINRELPFTEDFCNMHFTPPNYPELTNDEISYTIKILNSFEEKLR